MAHDKATTKSKSIGWYSLAQLVSRKEKERAIGVYKLLAYSFDDKAYALQVEADLLWAFDDSRAIEVYVQAAGAYLDSNHTLAALGVYEHICLLDGQVFDYHAQAVLLALRLMRYEKVLYHIEQAISLHHDRCARDDQIKDLGEKVLHMLASHHDSHDAQRIKTLVSDRCLLRKP